MLLPFFDDRMYRFPSGLGTQIQLLFKSEGTSVIHSGIQSVCENCLRFIWSFIACALLFSSFFAASSKRRPTDVFRSSRKSCSLRFLHITQKEMPHAMSASLRRRLFSMTSFLLLSWSMENDFSLMD